MKFTLLDRILSIKPNKLIKAAKSLSLGEDYLADHFPGNPVMPGVLQLEAMAQAAAWLLRVSKNFSCSMVVLSEGKNIRYGKFVAPGDTLIVEVKMGQEEGDTVWFFGKGYVDGNVVVKGQFALRYYNLADKDGSLAHTDKLLIEAARAKFRALGGEKLLQEASP